MITATLKRIFRAIEEEAAKNPGLARRIELALTFDDSKSPAGRRLPARVDPQEVLNRGGDALALRTALFPLTEDQLKDVISQYGMDPKRLALKWKSHARLLEHIIATAMTRSRKGDAFRS